MKIFAEPDRLKSAAAVMEQEVSEYEKLYQQLYTHVDQMQNVWKGKDNMAYTEQIRSFHTDFIKMSNLMKEYIAFLRNSANLYETTQNELANKARLL